MSVLCRRRTAVTSGIVDWARFCRTVDDALATDQAGDAVTMQFWTELYDESGATRPECWREGLAKPDGHTVSVSDVYFVANRLRLMDVRLGEAAGLDEAGVVCKDGRRIDTSRIVKAMGYELNEGNECILGRCCTGGSGLVAASLWLHVEPHLDGGIFNNLFATSGHMNVASFVGRQALRYWRTPGLAQRVLQGVQRFRMNTLRASEMSGVHSVLESIDSELTTLARANIGELQATFFETMPLDEYITRHKLEWQRIHDELLPLLTSPAVQSPLPYPSPSLFARLGMTTAVSERMWNAGRELSDQALSHSIRCQASPERAATTTISLGRIAQVIQELTGGEHVDADSPLSEAGLDSLAFVELNAKLKDMVGGEVDLPATLAFDMPTARLVAGFLGDRQGAVQPPSCRHLPLRTVLSIDEVLNVLQELIGSEHVDADSPLSEAGLDSLALIELNAKLKDMVGGEVDLPATLAFDMPTARLVAGFLGDRQGAVQPPSCRHLPLRTVLSIDEVLNVLQELIGSEHVDADSPLSEAGLDSLALIELNAKLKDMVGGEVDLPARLAFDMPTARLIVGFLGGRQGAMQPPSWTPSHTDKLVPSGMPSGVAAGWVLTVKQALMLSDEYFSTIWYSFPMPQTTAEHIFKRISSLRTSFIFDGHGKRWRWVVGVRDQLPVCNSKTDNIDFMDRTMPVLYESSGGNLWANHTVWDARSFLNAAPLDAHCRHLSAHEESVAGFKASWVHADRIIDRVLGGPRMFAAMAVFDFCNRTLEYPDSIVRFVKSLSQRAHVALETAWYAFVMVLALQCADKAASIFWVQDPNRNEDNADIFGYVTNEVGVLVEVDAAASFDSRLVQCLHTLVSLTIEYRNVFPEYAMVHQAHGAAITPHHPATEAPPIT